MLGKSNKIELYCQLDFKTIREGLHFCTKKSIRQLLLFRSIVHSESRLQNEFEQQNIYNAELSICMLDVNHERIFT